MTLITQCPKCQTRFNLSQYQLNKANGKVRCGSCSLVFDARGSLEEMPGGDAETQHNQQHSGGFITPESFQQEPAERLNPAPTLVASPNPKIYPSFFPLPQNESLQRMRSSKLGPRPPLVQQHQRKTSKAVEPSIHEIKPVRRYLREESKPVKDDIINQIELKPGQKDDLLIEDHFRKEPKKIHNYLNIFYLLLSVLGLFLVVLQLTLINRVYISANFPIMENIIKAACQKIGCQVPLPSDVSMLRTEFSDMSKVPEHNNLWQITIVLKNHAYYAQNYPLLELELKDTQAKVIMRRKLTPKEYLKSSNLELKQLNADSEVNINLHLDVGSLPVKGYNINWIYPDQNSK